MYGATWTGKKASRDKIDGGRDGRTKLALDGWTPDLVSKELVEAVRWTEKRMTHPDLSPGETFFPGITLSADVPSIEDWPPIRDHGISNTRARPSSSSRIAQFERILLWPSTYLHDHTREGHVLYVWTRSKVRRFAKLDDACDHMGWARATAYRALDRALTSIAKGLTADNIRRDGH